MPADDSSNLTPPEPAASPEASPAVSAARRPQGGEAGTSLQAGSTALFPSVEELAAWLPRYDVQERISAGRQSAVYRARHIGLDRPVMLRILLEPTPEEVTLLLERLRKRARLAHPKIVGVYDFGRAAPGLLYLATEHVDGEVLEVLIQSRKLTKPLAYQLALDLCEALQVVHDQRMVHGALSARTVLVTREGELKLTGIGMAETESGELSWLEESVGDAADDIRALGVVIHEMFSRESPDASGRVSRNLPPAFARVLLRCLNRDVSRRFERPKEVRAALTEALRAEQRRAAASSKSAGGEGPAARPSSVVPPSAPSVPPPPVAMPASGPPPDQSGDRARHPIRTLMAWLDRMFWMTVRTTLHLSIILGTLAILLVMLVMKDWIVIEVVEPPASETREPAAATPRQAPPPPVQQPLGLGPLPPAPLLNVPPPPGAPVAVPKAGSGPQAQLDAQYLNAVQREITATLESSRLDDMPYLKRELERLQNRLPMPQQDEPDLPARLKQLRDAYRRETAKLRAAGKVDR